MACLLILKALNGKWMSKQWFDSIWICETLFQKGSLMCRGIIFRYEQSKLLLNINIEADWKRLWLAQKQFVAKFAKNTTFINKCIRAAANFLWRHLQQRPGTYLSQLVSLQCRICSLMFQAAFILLTELWVQHVCVSKNRTKSAVRFTLAQLRRADHYLCVVQLPILANLSAHHSGATERGSPQWLPYGFRDSTIWGLCHGFA